MIRVRLVARLGGFRSPRAPWVIGSAAAHLLFLVSVLFLPTFGGDPNPDLEFIPVTLSAQLPGPSVPAPQVVTPPAPEPQSQQTEPESATLADAEPQVVKKPPRKEPEKKPPPDPRPREQPAVSSPAPGEAGPGPGGTGGEIAFLHPEDVEFAWYRDRVSAALMSHWRQPMLAGLGQPRSVTIYFEIMRNGAVRNLRIENPSSVPSLDRSALRAVVEADPLPPLPPSWRRSIMSARYVFRWYPER